MRLERRNCNGHDTPISKTGDGSHKSPGDRDQRSSIHAGLKPEHLRALKDNATMMSYEAGEVILREGDPANLFYLIQHGKVALESDRPEAEPLFVQYIGPGDMLGWSCLFPPYYWHFDARAAGARLRSQCEEDHDLGYELLKRMSAVVIQRLQATRRQLLAVKAKE